MDKKYGFLIISVVILLSAILVFSMVVKGQIVKNTYNCGSITYNEKSGAGCCCNYPVCSRKSLLCCGGQATPISEASTTIAAQ